MTRVESEPDVVWLWWFGAEAEGDAIVERRESGSAWRAIGAASVPGPGSYSFEDRDVTPGREYVYRLQVTRSGTTLTSDETRVVVPALHDLALALASGNPSRRLGVRFALPDAAPARLELFDVSGRRRFAREVGVAGAGEHDEAIETPGLSPGVYVIRLTRGAQVRSARAVLVR